VARRYAAKPLTYAEIASEWSVIVRRELPEIDVRFTLKDVFRLFEHHKVRRQKDRVAA
jgi:hypothetical protein